MPVHRVGLDRGDIFGMEEPWDVRSTTSERSMCGELFDLEYELRNFSLHVPSDISFEERAFGGVTEDEIGDLQESDDSKDSDSFGDCNDDDDFRDCNNYEEPDQVVEVTQDAVSEVCDSSAVVDYSPSRAAGIVSSFEYTPPRVAGIVSSFEYSPSRAAGMLSSFEYSTSEVHDTVPEDKGSEPEADDSERCAIDSIRRCQTLVDRLQKLAGKIDRSPILAADLEEFHQIKRAADMLWAGVVDLGEVDLEEEHEFEELNTEEDGSREEPERGYVVKEEESSEEYVPQEYALEEESEEIEDFTVSTIFTEGGLLEGETRYGHAVGRSPKTPVKTREKIPGKTHFRGVQKRDNSGGPISRPFTPNQDSLSESKSPVGSTYKRYTDQLKEAEVRRTAREQEVREYHLFHKQVKDEEFEGNSLGDAKVVGQPDLDLYDARFTYGGDLLLSDLKTRKAELTKQLKDLVEFAFRQKRRRRHIELAFSPMYDWACAVEGVDEDHEVVWESD